MCRLWWAKSWEFLKENWGAWQFTVTVHKAVRIIIDTFISQKNSTLLQYKQWMMFAFSPFVAAQLANVGSKRNQERMKYTARDQ
jgi:hypothetical protein